MIAVDRVEYMRIDAHENGPHGGRICLRLRFGSFPDKGRRLIQGKENSLKNRVQLFCEFFICDHQ